MENAIKKEAYYFDEYADYFYIDDFSNRILWCYFNPSADSGAQFVCNWISKYIMAAATEGFSLKDLEKQECIDEIFNNLYDRCEVYLLDWWDEDFCYCKNMMENEKPDKTGLSGETINWLIDYFATPISL